MTPYLCKGPTLLAISGGRTSGFMLAQVLAAHGGTLPPDCYAVFCNTGREHEATLRFLHEIESRWCPLVWLEYRHRPEQSPVHTYEQVDYCRASRNGEPFAALIQAKKMLPNPVTRFCTSELKIRTSNRYAKTTLGWSEWDRFVGLRADEPRRVAKLRGEGGEEPTCPIHRAGHTLADVRAFWRSQPFDLDLPGDDPAFGNCDLCFLKTRAKIEKVMQSEPSRAEWWAAQELPGVVPAEGDGRFFRNDRPTYRQMVTQLTVQGRLLDDAIDDDTLPCACSD